MTVSATSKYAATIAVVTCIPSGSSDSAFTLSRTSVRSSTLSRRLLDSSSAESSIMFRPFVRGVAVWPGQSSDSSPHPINEFCNMKTRSMGE